MEKEYAEHTIPEDAPETQRLPLCKVHQPENKDKEKQLLIRLKLFNIITKGELL